MGILIDAAYFKRSKIVYFMIFHLFVINCTKFVIDRREFKQDVSNGAREYSADLAFGNGTRPSSVYLLLM